MPYLIGDGLFADPIESEKYYKSVDMGYARLIYYFGMIGMIVYLAYQFKLSCMTALSVSNENRKIFGCTIALFILICNLKGMADITSYAAYYWIGSSIINKEQERFVA